MNDGSEANHAVFPVFKGHTLGGRPSTPSDGKSPGPHPCWPLWAGPFSLSPPLAVSPCIQLCDTLGRFMSQPMLRPGSLQPTS